MMIALLFFSLFFVVSPVVAQPISYSFSELSLIFYLGLSIPIILLALYRSLAQSTIFIFPCLLFIALFLLFGCISEKVDVLDSIEHQIWLCSSASFYFALLHVMPNKEDWMAEIWLEKTKYFTLSLVVLLALFVSSMFVLPDVELKFKWLVWFVLASFISYCRGYLLIREQNSSYLWLLIAFVTTLSSGATFWLWGSKQLAAETVYLILGAGYFIVILHFAWALTKSHSQQQLESEKTEPVDWQLYARDVVTNFPLQGQAIKKVESLFLNNRSERLAAIAFKPVNFAQANKILGYENSDALLLQLAYSMQKQSVSIDGLVNLSFSNVPFYVARLHSLHFLIVFDLSENPHDDKEVVSHVCQQLISAIPQAMTFKSYSMNFELAFGVSMIDKGDSSVKQVFAYAEDALITAEQTNQSICFFDQQISQLSQKQLVRMEQLKEAILQDSFSYFIQPQINLITKDVVGYEFIMRWSISQEKVLGQAEIAEIAEQSGDTYRLFRMLLNKAITWLKKLENNNALKPVSINLTSLELLDEVTVEYIDNQLSQAGIASEYLMICVSEHLLLSVADRVKVSFDQLRSNGVQIAISNFSGNYEALRYVRRLMINQVRISCEALCFKDEREPEKAITNALIHLASVIQLPLIGTRIDSAAVEMIFRELAGENAQGEIVAPAVKLEEASHWLTKWLAYQN